MNRLSKILMNQADGSPGGGAAPSNPPQAQGATAAPASAIDVAALASALAPMVSKQVTDQVQQAQNSVFATLRKAGVLDENGNGKRQAAPQAGGDGNPPAAQSVGMTPDDVERIVAQRTAYAVACAEQGLTPEQRTLIDDLYAAKKPPNPADFVAATVKALGIGRAATTTTTIQSAASAATRTASVTNTGAPAPVPTVSDDTPLLRLSPEQVEHLIRTKGEDWVATKWAEEMRTTTIKLR